MSSDASDPRRISDLWGCNVVKQEAAAVYVRPDELKPWGRNPRKGKPVAEVAESIRRFGFAAPIVARLDGTIIAGHTRLEAAQLLGLELVPVRFVDLDEQEAAALALADNRLSELAEWDDDGLTSILAELEEASVPIDGLGWDADALRDLLGSGEPVTEPTDDDAPSVDDGVVHSRAGEMYQLGPHRLLCGDCRKPEDVARLFDGASINLAFTSPPYAAQRTYDDASGFKPIAPDDYVEWFDAVQANVRSHLAEDGSWFVNIKPASDGLDTESYVLDLVLAHSRRWGWHFATEFCWERGGFPGKPGRRFKNQFEPIYQFALGEWKFRPEAVRHQSAFVARYSPDSHWAHGLAAAQGSSGAGWADVGEGLAYPGNRLPCMQNAGGGHPAAFPVALPEFFVRAYTDPGDIVYEPFGGSGTTLIAAAKHERICYGVEISPRYCDVIRRRWTRWARENNQDPGPGALDDEVADASANV